MDNNLRCGKSCLVALRLLFRRALFIYVLSSILDGSHISWLTITAWISTLLLILLDLLVVRILLLFLLFPHRSFFFAFSDFVFEAGLKALHLRAHQVALTSVLSGFVDVSLWASFAFLCYFVLLLLLILISRICRRRASSSSSQSEQPASDGNRNRARTHKSFGRINTEDNSAHQNLRPRLSSAPASSRVENSPGDYRAWVIPALLLFISLAVLCIFGLITLVSGIAIVGLQLALNSYSGTFLWIIISNWVAFGDAAFALVQDLIFLCLGRQQLSREAKVETFMRGLFAKYEAHQYSESLTQN